MVSHAWYILQWVWISNLRWALISWWINIVVDIASKYILWWIVHLKTPHRLNNVLLLVFYLLKMKNQPIYNTLECHNALNVRWKLYEPRKIVQVGRTDAKLVETRWLTKPRPVEDLTPSFETRIDDIIGHWKSSCCNYLEEQ